MTSRKRKKSRPQPRFEQIPLKEIRALILASGHTSAPDRSNGKAIHLAPPQSSKREKKHNGKQSHSRKQKMVKFDLSKDLWISPTLSLRGKHGDRAWDRSGNLPPGTGMRLLELADIALGLKKHTSQAKAVSAAAHQTTKSEPYSL
jgi:hypothetical protein